MASILGSMFIESFEFELSLKHGCEQQIQAKSFTHISSICCPLTFCRNEKKGKEQGPAYIIPNPTQRSLVLQEDRCTRNQAERMQSFASYIWCLTFAFLFIAWQVLPGKYSTQTSASLPHVSTLLSYPSFSLPWEKKYITT